MRDIKEIQSSYSQLSRNFLPIWRKRAHPWEMAHQQQKLNIGSNPSWGRPSMLRGSEEERYHQWARIPRKGFSREMLLRQEHKWEGQKRPAVPLEGWQQQWTPTDLRRKGLMDSSLLTQGPHCLQREHAWGWCRLLLAQDSPAGEWLCWDRNPAFWLLN